MKEEADEKRERGRSNQRKTKDRKESDYNKEDEKRRRRRSREGHSPEFIDDKRIMTNFKSLRPSTGISKKRGHVSTFHKGIL